MNWFIVVYFLVNGFWIEADTLGKEGWSPIKQENYNVCYKKIIESNNRFAKIAEYREIDLDIKFECECRNDAENLDIIKCKPRNWFQKIWDKLTIIK